MCTRTLSHRYGRGASRVFYRQSGHTRASIYGNSTSGTRCASQYGYRSRRNRLRRSIVRLTRGIHCYLYTLSRFHGSRARSRNGCSGLGRNSTYRKVSQVIQGSVRSNVHGENDLRDLREKDKKLGETRVGSRAQVSRVACHRDGQGDRDYDHRVGCRYSRACNSGLLNVASKRASTSGKARCRQCGRRFRRASGSLSSRVGSSLRSRVFLRTTIEGRMARGSSRCHAYSRHRGSLHNGTRFLFLLYFLFCVFLFRSDPPLFRPCVLSTVLSDPTYRALRWCKKWGCRKRRVTI